MFSSVRVRLTAWYVLVFGLLLVLFSIFVYLTISRSLYQRIDTSLQSSVSTAASVLNSEVEESSDVIEASQETVAELKSPDVSLTVVWRGGVVASSAATESSPAVSGDLLASVQSGIAVYTVTGPNGRQRVAVTVMDEEGSPCYVVSGQSLEGMIDQLRWIRTMLMIGLIVALLVASAGGLLLAKKSLAPVVAMSEQARRISANNLHERLMVTRKSDELGGLAAVFNQLLERLDHSFEDMRAFIADASHELRTPLSIIRVEAEVALSQDDRDTVDYRDTLAVIQDEARRLSRIVDEMLELARADAGQRPIRHEEFYINDVLEECCRALQVLASCKGVMLRSESPADIGFNGDEDMIRRMMLNLIDNAIKYTPAGGSVLATLSKETGEVNGLIRLQVKDTGIGIPEESTAKVFTRFYRVNSARSRSDGGSGLGLAIAKWVAEAHGGTISVESTPGNGSTFTIILPSA